MFIPINISPEYPFESKYIEVQGSNIHYIDQGIDVSKVIDQYSQKLLEFDFPKLLFYARPGGLISFKTVKWCQQNFKNIKTINIVPGIHYLQEDNPGLIGSELAQWHTSLK